MTAYLAFSDILKDAEIDDRGHFPDFPPENMLDWFTYTFFKPSVKSSYVDFTFDKPTPCNYLSIASTNYGDLAADPDLPFDPFTVALYGIDMDSGELTVLLDIKPKNNSPIFSKFDLVHFQKYRFYQTRYDISTPPLVGVLSIGECLELPVGIQAPFTPPQINFDDKVFNSQSSKGQFLGRSVERYANKTTISQKNINPQWLRENWKDVIRMLEKGAFFYCWNYEEYPEDTVYCWLDGDLPMASYVSPIHASFDIKCRALHEMDWF